MSRLSLTGLLLAAYSLTGCAGVSVHNDAETAAWWRTTADLSSDAMEGRDTGSPGHARAVAYVAERFRAAGLQPAGDNGTFVQSIPLHEVAVTSEGTALSVVRRSGGTWPLRFLHDVTVTPTDDLPAALDGELVFRGYCSAAEMQAVQGRIVVCFGARRTGMPGGGERLAAATAAGAIGLVNVDDPGFDIEPPRWPVAYARSVGFANATPGPARIPVMRLAASVFSDVIDGVGQDADAILATGSRSAPLPSFDIPARLQARFSIRKRDYSSDNVLGVLPGTDPALANQPVLVDAHLDGYGYGEPVNGDGLYNGALDDAAYVATLIQLADRQAGRGFRRPVIFAAFTGEEKGLLGSRWLADHPTQAAPLPVAVINLDQLRPLYPLTILTTMALDDSTLGQTVRDVAGPMGIEVRPDREPERGLLRRSDHWPFMQKGVPAVSFIFGYDPGTEAERRYREWYTTRYHLPQDDMTTLIDHEAAGAFNRFFFTLTERVANADTPPQWLPDSPYRPRNAD